MFGYIKPQKCSLRVREWEHYRAVYCGLCNTLKRRYGLSARFIVNYDFTFLSLVLEAAGGQCGGYEYKRCIASPLSQKCACVRSDALDIAADASVILTWWQLCDAVMDKPFWSGMPARLSRLFLRRAYRRAAGKLPSFDAQVRACLNELHGIEAERAPSYDRPADTFARILAAMSEFCDGAEKRRILREMFYHIGRIVYLTDALADVSEDLRSGNYNPVLARLSVTALPLSDEQKESVVSTINQSIHAAIAAFSLIDAGETRGLIENILYLGIPAVVHDAASGAKPKKENRLHERPV